MRLLSILRPAVILLLTLGLLAACAQPPKVETEPEPDAGLLEFEQLKLHQLEQLERELGELEAEMVNMEAEIEHYRSLIKPGMHRITPEELTASFVLPGLIEDLAELKNERTKLLAKKQYLEQDVDEVGQYARLADYYQFKQSQLDDLTTELIVLRIDIDQGIAGAQQEYDRLLPQREFLQQDISELQQLLEEA